MKGIETPTVVIYEDDKPRSILVRRCKLLVSEGDDRGKEVVVSKERFTVGANPHNDCVLADTTVSGNHCEIELLPEGYLIRDLQSTNGTFVRGVRVTEAFLSQGADFQLGKTRLVFSPLKESTKVELSQREGFGNLIGGSVAMKKVYSVIETYAATDVTTLITGETGTGKEVLAAELHNNSTRKDKPFVVVDCSALSRNLIESELFGHRKGAFTGAMADRKGAFEQADSGTVFLDEIGDLSIDLQPKLLRVLEKKELRRVGDNTVRKIDVRIIAATHRRLEVDVNAGRFREDLYYRLSVVRVEVPPLSKRKEDVGPLAQMFIDRLAKETGTEAEITAEEIVSMFQDYDWPGNVRELRNSVERMFHARENAMHMEPLLADEPGAEVAEELRQMMAEPGGKLAPFKVAKEQLVHRFERDYIVRILKNHDWNISQAAREAEIERAYLQRLIKKHELKR